MDSYERRRAREAQTCSEKRPLTSWDAEDLAERHIDCGKCAPDRAMGPYRCPINPAHWHIGHQTVSGAR